MTVTPLGRAMRLITDRGSRSAFRIGLEAIESGTGRMVPTPVNDYSSEGIDFEEGDVLFGKLRPYLAKVWLADRTGAAVGDFHVYRPDRLRLLPAFLRYLILSQEFLEPVNASVVGAKMPRAEWATVRDLKFQLPSVDQQEAIAAYLDRETAQIDAFIAKNENLIALLTERRAAEIDWEFSTKPRDTRLSDACETLIDTPHTTPPECETGEYEAIRTASVRDGRFVPNRGIPVSRETWEQRNAGRGPRRGDVLFTREAPAGEACLVPNERLCLGQRTVLLRVDHANAVGDFLVWQLYSKACSSYFEMTAHGSTVSNIRLPLLRNCPIWLPSLEVQNSISAKLEERTRVIEKAIAVTQDTIALAKERRSALISAAVTGQIDIREAS